MSSEANKAVIRRIYAEVFNQHNAARIAELYAPDWTYHAPFPAIAPGVAGMTEQMTGVFTAFPDIVFTIQDLLADGDKVITRYLAVGTHRGEMGGIAPTGKRLTHSGITIERLVDGKVAETWEEWSSLTFMQELGLVALPEQAPAQP
jgi:steroid delta-isomerase-like uncharacterized protein